MRFIKTADGKLVPALSMGGLTGLTALEGSHAFDKNKSKKERVMAGAGAAATGSILASEVIHNKPWRWMKRAHVQSLEKLAAGIVPNRIAQAAKSVGTATERAAAHGVTAQKAPQLTGLAKMKALSQQPIESTAVGNRKFLTRLASVKTAGIVSGALSIFRTE